MNAPAAINPADLLRRAAPFDPHLYRRDFPGLEAIVHGKPLVYLDNANTAQKPRAVIDAVSRYYTQTNANVSRAVHSLGAQATALYEGTRDRIAALIGAHHRDEIVLTSGTTHAINLVAYSWAMPRLEAGDTILLTQMEHHANIVPWQLVAARTGAVIKVVPIDESGDLKLDVYRSMLTPDVKLVGVVHASNALGTINPVADMCRMARAVGIPVLVDGSQAVPHFKVDVKSIGCDFYVFTGHKLFGPTGTGALWAKRATLEAMPPFFGGGEMIRQVTFEKTTYNDAPHRFEAGTPNIAGVIGLGAAIDYVNMVGHDRIESYERELLAYATGAMKSVSGLRIIGEARNKVPVIAFVVEGAHAHDLATIIDTDGVAVRSGHHCAHPLMQFYGVPATARMSLAFYNTREEVDRCVTSIERARRMLA